MFENIRADIARKRSAYVVRPEDQTLFRKYIKVNLQMGTAAVLVYRFGRWAKELKVPILREALFVLYNLLNMAVMLCAGINIHVYSTIGKGLVIHNFSCIFILAERMGENCTVNQGVTIGNIRGKKHPPIIGNNVYFGAGCKVLGDVTIGDHVVIAANSLVVTDVPDHCTVVGVPARIVSRDAKSPYLQYTEYDASRS
jgi:serine O-acetyltransferase